MRRWIVQIRSMIASQNASLLDAILLWKENVDHEFNGLDPCPICYSVVHVTRHTLPRLAFGPVRKVSLRLFAIMASATVCEKSADYCWCLVVSSAVLSFFVCVYLLADIE